MKKIISLLLLSTLYHTVTSAQIKIGQSISDIPVQKLLNAPVKNTSLGKLKGKVILLEFWATYCSPCLDAMPHLKALQKTYYGKLQIITVTTEKEKRIKQFLINRPSNLWFAIDTADAFKNDFPYHIIPHSVLIDARGIVVAITLPNNITSSVIEKVVAGKEIDLPIKEDNMNKDPWVTFITDTNTVSHFIVQPKIAGSPSGIRRYLKDSTFKNRRISMLNLPLEAMYRIANGDLPYGRTIDLTPKENVVENKEMYCIDIIVPKGKEKELIPTLKKELLSRFDLQANVEKRLKQVYILTIADANKIAVFKQSTASKEDFSASHGAFNGEHIRLKKIADYLEDFGLVDFPVVDETGNNFLYDIQFTYMPEKKGDLENELFKLGLKLVKGDREIDMLVFR